ncbi:hypothetical protein ACFWIQ_03175 [Kitasatospora sp. NPDC127059]|uniref:hypothetical protein n=1 Tax=unclassified Kitasatospora TaxID=2633591 RepID=UPI00366A1F3E
MLARLVEIVVWGAVLTGLTVVLISSVSPVEMAVAGAAALGGGLAAQQMRRAAGVRIAGGRGAGRALLVLPRAVLRGLAVLVADLVTTPTAGVRRVRLRPGAAAAWAGALIAASPDTCVIDVPNDDEVVVHALRPGAGPVEEAVASPEAAP